MSTALATSRRPPGSMFEELHPALSESGAIAEADRCLECGGRYAPAPCVVACPADVDVPSFIDDVARGNPDRAAQTIFAENLLGATCARVCPVEVLCEGACVLEREGRRPVSIAALQRYATDHALANGVPPRSRARPTGHPVAVLGAGPAGLVCAGELAALGHHVVVYDARDEIGGLVRYGIAPFRQEREPLPEEMRVLAELGVEFRLGHLIDGPDALRQLEAEADAVFLGVGLGEDVHVTYPGDELPGVWESLPFIEAIKTEHFPEVGKQVAVIGGGNTAIDVAREALRLGAPDVTLLYRRTEAEMPAYRHEVDEARAEGVRFQWLTNPISFVGHDRLEAVQCQYMQLGDPDASGRRRPEPVPGTEFMVPAQTAVKAIGQKPRRKLLGWIDGLELDGGDIRTDPDTCRTTNPRYFAAGDAVTGGATVVEAVSGAKIAASAIHELLTEGAS
jgi:dihydropyrimidine dehydrogenase (NAD+) subunit PreT